MGSDFLDPTNVCGKQLLRIVSQGNAIIAEIFRLSELIPKVFRMDTKELQNDYNGLILDFEYFKSCDTIDKQIESNDKLASRDEGLRETYLDIVTKFYLVFESIHRYSVEFERFLFELEDGLFIQQTLDNVMQDSDGKQLLCEALYLLGVMLLTLDQKIEGSIRERIVVAYYRYGSQKASDSHIDDICHLVRSTGFVPRQRRPPNYPEDLFKRVKICETFTSLVISCLRSDDVYNATSTYPLAEHRSSGLATQSAMLFVCLFFSPKILHNENATMREIVDKFFADNFVISFYMGKIINLVEYWDPYKAAKLALNNTTDNKNLKNNAQRFGGEMKELNSKLVKLLKDGVLTNDRILDKINEYINISRKSNIALRWLMLHTVPLAPEFADGSSCVKKVKQLREQIVYFLDFDPSNLFSLLLNTSEFELRIKENYKQLLSDQCKDLQSYKTEIIERIQELSEVFSGTKPLNRVTPNEELSKWFDKFKTLSEEIEIGDNFDSTIATSNSKKLFNLIKAIENIKDFEPLERNAHVKQFIEETLNYLKLMIKTMNIKESVLITLQIIGDLSYAWRIIDDCFTMFMQDGIKRDPKLVSKLRACFLKLASALDLPLLRINQACDSNDLMLVSRYYSTELVIYVSKVLHIIPETMFSIMTRIISIQTVLLRELPTRLMKDQIRDHAQFKYRYELAELTNKVAVFTEGVLAMKTTLVGVIQIDPKKLLEDGIRRELVKQVAKVLHNSIMFHKSKSSPQDVIARIQDMDEVMDGFRRSFEYVQDYVCTNGLKMWQEEISRIFHYNVEQECNVFMKQKILDYQSVYQSKSIPIPNFMPTDTQSLTFVGRFVREVEKFTNPKTTIYVYSTSTWYDSKDNKQIFDSTLFSLILKSFGVTGTNGIDRIISFQIQAEMENFFKEISVNFTKNKAISDCFAVIDKDMHNETPNCVITAKAFIANFRPLIVRLSKTLNRFFDILGFIGQYQILRLNISYTIQMSSKFQARQLNSALMALNNSLLNDYAIHCRSLSHNSTHSAVDFVPSVMKEESALLFELSNYLEHNGYTDPLFKVYSSRSAPANFDKILILIVMSQLSKFVYCPQINSLISSTAAVRSGESVDAIPFVIGLISILRQFPFEITSNFLSVLGQLVGALITSKAEGNSKSTKDQFSPEVLNLIQFLHHFCVLGNYKRALVCKYLPDIILDHYQSLSKL